MDVGPHFKNSLRSNKMNTCVASNTSPHFLVSPSRRISSLLTAKLGILATLSDADFRVDRESKSRKFSCNSTDGSSKGNVVDVVPLKSCLSRLTISNCSSTASTRQSVRFRTDQAGGIVEFYETPSVVHYITPGERRKCWWTKKELIEIRKRAVQTCRFYLASRPDYRMAAIRMMDRCGAERVGHTPNVVDGHMDEDFDMCIIVNGDSRGLEKRLFNAMKLPFFRYKRSLSSVLTTQARLQAADASCFSPCKKAKLIASQYSSNSKYATVWAQKLASADSQILQEMCPAHM
jgi:hypothetical protein